MTAEKIKNNVITNNKLNNRSVTGSKIAEKGVETGNLAEGAVTAAKIGKGAVTNEKLAPEVLNNVSPLKQGQTLRGVFDLGGLQDEKQAELTEAPTARGAISLQQTLAATPAVTIVKKGAPTSAACPGTGGGGTTPEAAAGNLCIYLTTETNLDPANPLIAESANRLGTGLVAKAKEKSKGEFAAIGVWAVTAP